MAQGVLEFVLPQDLRGSNIQVVPGDWTGGQVVGCTAASAASAISSATKHTLVRISCPSGCWYTVAANPTAAVETAGSDFLAAGAIEYVPVPANFKIAVIKHTAATDTKLSARPAGSLS